MTELDRVLERVRQNRAARVRTLTTADTNAPENRARAGGTFTAGARVFDLVSGQDAEVLYGTRENVLVSTPQR